MIPKIFSIYEKIKQNKVNQVWLGRKEEVIKATKLLTCNQEVFEKEVLYIGKLSDVVNIKADCPGLNLICLEDTRVPEELIQIYGINLMLIDGCTSIEEVFNEVQDIIVDSYYFVRSSSALLNSIIQGRGLPYILEIGSELLGNPLMLGDSKHRILAYSKCDDVEDSAWNELRDLGYCTYEYTEKYDFKKHIERSANSNTPVIGDLGKTSSKKRIFAKVVIEDKIVGHLAVLEHKRLFTDRDLEIVSFLCDIISAEMQKNRYYSSARNVMIENLIVGLLREDFQNSEMIFDRIKYLKWRLPTHMYVMAIRYNSYEDTFGLISYIREMLKHLSEENETVFFENHLILIVGCNGEQYLNREDFHSMIDFLKKNKLIAGISQEFSNITLLKKHYEQALTAMQLGQKLGKEEVFFAYEDYSIYHIIDICCKQHDIREFCHPALLKLQTYDLQHKTDYVKTLITYVTSMRNLGSTAEALFIHRNTMSYRLTKIHEIIGMELDNDDLNLNLFVSYKLLEYAGKL